MFKAEVSPASISESDPQTRGQVRKSHDAREENGLAHWFSWPKPPGGFIDLGWVCMIKKRVLRMLIV